MESTKHAIREHRAVGRGRKAFWVAVAIVAVAAIVRLAPVRADPERALGGSFGRSGAPGPMALAEELRAHSDWLAHAGLTATQVDRVAGLLDRQSPVLAELATARAAIQRRAADAVRAEVLDPDAFAALRTDAKDLADRTLDTSFDLTIAIARELTPEQRADLVRHWTGTGPADER